MASQPSLLDKLAILPVAGTAITSAILRLLTGPFIGGAKGNTFFKDVVFAALRSSLTYIPAGTEQWINGTTESEYLALAKKQDFQPETEVLQGGVKVHWLGDRKAEKVLLYFHGGGYVLAASLGHLQWLYDFSRATGVAVVLVSYTLAPHGQYPLQLEQAAESLEWLLDSQKKKPSDIFIGGDSAGGNMATMLISHLLHPHSAVKSTINLSEPLAGAILISPWTYFGTDDESVKRNATSDMVTATAANRWSSAFLGSAKWDNYNQPHLADAAWFKGLDTKVKDVLIWSGGGEVLIDSIERFRKQLQQAHPRVEYVMQPGAAHEDFIFDKMLGYKADGEGAVAVESWVKARL